MSEKTVLKFDNVTKVFSVKHTYKTLFRLSQSLSQFNKPKSITALKNVSFEIQKGEKIGIIGLNGSGKTTLLRIASGILLPSSGQVIRKEPLMPLLKFSLFSERELPVIDNIFIIGSFWSIPMAVLKERAAEIIEYSGLQNFTHVPFGNLSGGQAQKLCFSIFIHTDFDFIALDESLSVADLSFRNKCSTYSDKLLNSNKTILMISHNIHFLKENFPKTIWLHEGEIREIGESAKVLGSFQKFATPT